MMQSSFLLTKISAAVQLSLIGKDEANFIFMWIVSCTWGAIDYSLGDALGYNRRAWHHSIDVWCDKISVVST